MNSIFNGTALCAATLVLGFATIATAAKKPIALSPSGKWGLASTRKDCTLVRDFGSTETPITIAFKPFWNGNLGQILLVVPDRGGDARGETVAVQFGTMDAPVEMRAESGTKSGKRLFKIYVPGKELPDPRTGTTILLKLEHYDPIALAMPDAAEGFAALDNCQDAVMDRLGVFAYERRVTANSKTAAHDATGKAVDWITQDDYPPVSVAKHEQGTVLILWRIGLDGLVHDCNILESSGFPELDKASCDAIVRRGRYTPATDDTGNPRETHNARFVVWRL